MTRRNLPRLLSSGLSLALAIVLLPAFAWAGSISDTILPNEPIWSDEIGPIISTDGPTSSDPRRNYTLDTNLMLAQSLKAVTINREAAERSSQEAEKAIENLNKALTDLQAENRTLTAIKTDTSATDEDVAAAENRVMDAISSVKEAEKAANDAAANAMGVDADTVESMRDSGLSWLEVCRAIGVSPGVLGGAVDNESEEGTIAKALDSLLGSLKTADPKADKNKESGKSSSAGNSSGNGSGGGNGGGNGGGHGGGNGGGHGGHGGGGGGGHGGGKNK